MKSVAGTLKFRGICDTFAMFLRQVPDQVGDDVVIDIFVVAGLTGN